MKALMKKLFNPKKTSVFWLYFVFGAILTILGIMLMPVWANAADWVFFKNWGMSIVNLIIAACLLAYLFLFLIKKVMSKSNGAIKVLTIVEFVLLLLIVLGCILQQFKIIKVNGACGILGLAMWCRGSVEIFRAYYHQKGNNDKYPVWWLCVALALVSFGVYLFAKPLFQDVVILWIFIIVIFLFAIICFIDGVLSKPEGKTKKVKKSKK